MKEDKQLRESFPANLKWKEALEVEAIDRFPVYPIYNIPSHLKLVEIKRQCFEKGAEWTKQFIQSNLGEYKEVYVPSDAYDKSSEQVYFEGQWRWLKKVLVPSSLIQEDVLKGKEDYESSSKSMSSDSCDAVRSSFGNTI